jgi:hypothetical protein
VSYTYTDERGFIVDQNTEEVVGTWFTTYDRIGFHSPKPYVRKFIDGLQEDGIRSTDMHLTKQSVQSVPLSTLRHTFAAAGLQLLDETFVRDHLKKPNTPSETIGVSHPDTWFLGPRYYIVRTDSHAIVGGIRIEPDRVAPFAVEDREVRSIIERMNFAGVSRLFLQEAEFGEVSKDIPVGRATIQDLQDAFAPDYYLVPGPAVETA